MSHDKNAGFTLIELMLAMTFIAILLVAIAMTTIQIGNIYNKGITLREVNQAGRSVSEDLQRSIASSVAFDITQQQGSKYVVRPGGGRLCLGDYTYAWNYGKAIDDGIGGPDVFNKYNDNQAPVYFAKVADPSGQLCAEPTVSIDRTKATEMISSGDRDLVIHSFSIERTSNDPNAGQAIYAISMLIGTNDREQLTSNDASCKPPSEEVGDEDYCSVNQFDIIARAGNKAGGQ